MTAKSRAIFEGKKSEHDEQVSVVDYLNSRYPQVLFWSTPNGAHLAGNIQRRSAAINKLKAEGFLPGVSDIIIFEPRDKYSCMFLEMKREHGGVVSENQEWFLAQIEQRGGYGVVAKGFDEARQFIDEYLSWRKTK